jgi:FixJ family two-component response regulator
MCRKSRAKPQATSGFSAKLEKLNLLASPTQQSLAVCLLDDDPSALKATRRLLESVGWEVESFTDPFVFLEHARVHQPRVAVIDIRMPLMNGLEVQTLLRSVAPSTRVVILTSKDDPSVRAQALDAGASAFFLKLVDGQELLAGIENAAARAN